MIKSIFKTIVIYVLLGESIKHEPMYLNTGSYKDFPLETWSPYRASDQVALISMPNTKVVSKVDFFKSFKYLSLMQQMKKVPTRNSCVCTVCMRGSRGGWTVLSD